MVVALLSALAFVATANAATLSVAFDDTSAGAGTGSAPFDADNAPGNDSGAANHVVRSHDTITYHWALSANGGTSPNTTVTQTLPAGMAWANLPAYCLSSGTPVSSLSADKRTIVCNTGTQGSSAVDLYPTAIVSGLANGASLTTSITVSSSDPGTTSVTSAPVTDTVSAAPRVNLEKQNFYSFNRTYNGQDGVQISYSLALLIDSQGAKGMRGAETITQPITFTEDISGFFQPNAELVDFEPVNGGTGVPWSSIAGGHTATNAVIDSGTWTGTQASPGDDVAITITGADLSGDSLPTNAASGNALPADKQYLAVQIVSFFIPFASIPGNTAVPYTNVVSGFSPVSITGQQNYGPGGHEPLGDNVISGSYLKPAGEGGIGKYYLSHETPNGLITGATSANSADGILFPGQTFYAAHDWYPRDGAPGTIAKAILCDNLDTSSVSVSRENQSDPTIGSQPGPAWLRAPEPSNWVIEYTDGGTRGATPAAWYAADGPRDQRCEDSDAGPGGWVTDPDTLPGGMASVTSVRARQLNPRTSLQLGGMTLFVNYKVRTTDKNTGDPIVPGRKIANFMQFAKAPDAASPRVWANNTYDPLVNNNVLGAVASTQGGAVRISKDTAPSGQLSALTGSTVNFTLHPTSTTPVPTGGVSSPFTMSDVKVVDTIPAHMSYVAGSASRAPASVVVNLDGTTTVTWNLGDLPVNGAIAPITYSARVALTAPNGSQEVNVAVISSPDDGSSLASRTTDYTIRIDKVFGIVIDKSTTTPWIEPTDDAAFTIDYVNNQPSAVAGMDVIDVLPYTGDTRTPQSDFHGTAKLQSVTPDDPTDLVLYSSAASGSISSNPKDASNQPGGATTWCATAQLNTAGCPATVADATAVRVTRARSVAAGEAGSFAVVLSTSGNASGDRYVNDAGLAAIGVTLPAYSQPASVRVVASKLGDLVWDDTNSNGIQDAGEPGVPGVTVQLNGTDKNGAAVTRTTTTDADGKYAFAADDGAPNLISGTYTITFVAPSGYGFTTQGVGADHAVDSDAAVSTGKTATITIGSPIAGQADQVDLTWDAGLVKQPTTPTTPGGGGETCTGSSCEPGGGTDTSTDCTVSCENTAGSGDGSTPASGKPKLSVTKRAAKHAITAGQSIAYTIVVRNVGNAAAKNVVACDTPGTGLTVDHTPAGATFSDGRMCWKLGTLKAGAKRTIHVTMGTVATLPRGLVTNVVRVSAAGAKRVRAGAKVRVTAKRGVAGVNANAGVTG
jgi:uncharacterized repeat protein (TIGR01451 family)